MRSELLYLCRICGYRHEDPPWGDTGTDPSFAICSCCGVEFGYEDATIESCKRFRSAWLARGAPWFDPKDRPPGWKLEDALALVPSEYL
jgi:hypothetical protein